MQQLLIETVRTVRAAMTSTADTVRLCAVIAVTTAASVVLAVVLTR